MHSRSLVLLVTTHEKKKKILNVHNSVQLDLFRLNLPHLEFPRVVLCVSKEFS